MTPFELTDGVVLLDLPGPDDVEAVFRVCQDPDIQHWTTVPSPYRREHALSFVTEFIPNGWADGSGQTWVVRDVADGNALVGAIGLVTQPVRSAVIGYWLAPGARGRGLMGRAVVLVLDAAFDRLDLDRVEWRADEGNAPSRAVAERAGFRVEGCLRGGSVHGETRRDVWVGTVLRADDRPVLAIPG